MAGKDSGIADAGDEVAGDNLASFARNFRVEEPAFYLGDSKVFPGNKGMFAARKIEAGMLICEERPTVTSCAGTKPLALANGTELQGLMDSFMALDAEKRSQILALPGLPIFILSKNQTDAANAEAEGEEEQKDLPVATEATDDDIKEFVAKNGVEVPAESHEEFIKFLKVWTRGYHYHMHTCINTQTHTHTSMHTLNVL